VLLVADQLVERRFGSQGAGSAMGIIVGSVVDGVPESAILGIQVGIGATISLSFVAAVFISNIPRQLRPRLIWRQADGARDGSGSCGCWSAMAAWMAGSAASGATVRTCRSVLVTWLRAHTATRPTGPAHPARSAGRPRSCATAAATPVRSRPRQPRHRSRRSARCRDQRATAMSGPPTDPPARLRAAPSPGCGVITRCGERWMLLRWCTPTWLATPIPAGPLGPYASEARLPGIWLRWVALAPQCPISSSAASATQNQSQPLSP
jgi:hypothetical protein